jgi:hypothetical protein
LLEGHTRKSAHLRLCASCYDELLERLQANAIQLSYEPGQDQEVKLCVVCGESVSRASGLAVFATVFPRGDERIDFLGAAHPDCADTLASSWRLLAAA